MNLIPLSLPLAAGSAAVAILVSVVIVVVLIVEMAVIASRYRKVGPNEALIIYGRKHRFVDVDGVVRSRGFRTVKCGGTFVLPVVEEAKVLSLELLTIETKTPAVRTRDGASVEVAAVTQVKVKGDDVSIATAAEHFLSKKREEIQRIAAQTIQGHLRAILATLTAEDIDRNRDALAGKTHEMAGGDLANMGLNIISLTIHDVTVTRRAT